jgi:hypothetical protein
LTKKIDRVKKSAIERDQLEILMQAQQSSGLNSELLQQINLVGNAPFVTS